jgi:hypothetical protein
MAVDPVLASAAIAATTPRPAGDGSNVLAALQAGQTIDAQVLAKLESGAVRLGLLGTLLDIVADMPLVVGEQLTLTVVKPGPEFAVALSRGNGAPPLQIGGGEPAGAAAPSAPTQAAAAAGYHPLPKGPTVSPRPGSASPAADRAVALDLSGAARLAVGQTPPTALAITSPEIIPGPAGTAAVEMASVSRQTQAALAEMVPRAAANQQGRAPLIANAVALMASPAGERLPALVRETLAALIATALDPHGLDGQALRRAIENSGTFQEASLLKSAGVSLAGGAAPQAAPEPKGDAKAAILAVREALRAIVGDHPGPRAAAIPPPLPQKGMPAEGQPTALPSIPDGASPKEAARIVLSAADGALDRVRLLQAASLPDRAPGGADPASRNDRLVEIPIALPSGQNPVLGLTIGRDQRGSDAAHGERPAWRMRLSLDLAETGPIHAMVSLKGALTGVTLWAERPDTADLFRTFLPELRDALTVADLDVDTLDVREGTPPAPPPARAGAFVDLSS